MSPAKFLSKRLAKFPHSVVLWQAALSTRRVQDSLYLHLLRAEAAAAAAAANSSHHNHRIWGSSNRLSSLDRSAPASATAAAAVPAAPSSAVLVTEAGSLVSVQSEAAISQMVHNPSYPSFAVFGGQQSAAPAAVEPELPGLSHLTSHPLDVTSATFDRAGASTSSQPQPGQLLRANTSTSRSDSLGRVSSSHPAVGAAAGNAAGYGEPSGIQVPDMLLEVPSMHIRRRMLQSSCSKFVQSAGYGEVEVEIRELGLFKFKGNPDALLMAAVSTARLGSRKYPKTAPSGKVRLSCADHMHLASCSGSAAGLSQCNERQLKCSAVQ